MMTLSQRFLIVIGAFLVCGISHVEALPKQPSSNHAVLGGDGRTTRRNDQGNRNHRQEVILASKKSGPKTSGEVVTDNKSDDDTKRTNKNRFSGGGGGGASPILAVMGLMGNVQVGVCLAALWIYKTFVVKKRNAPLLIKSSSPASTSNNIKRGRNKNGKGKDSWMTVKTLSNADLMIISGISSAPIRGIAVPAAMPTPKPGSVLVLASGINSSTTVTMTPMAPPTPPRRTATPPPPQAEDSQAVIDTTASVYYPSPEEDHGVTGTVEVQLMRNHFQKTPLVRGGGAPSNALLERLKIGMYFGVWYALNVIYNIINKKVLNVLPAPVIVGTAQFGIGALYASLVWLVGLRQAPTLTGAGKAAVTKVGLCHSLGQLTAMISIEAGTVSFTHIVKALEPFFSAVVSGLYFKKWMAGPVYATLIPVVGGVGYACLKERSFSWLAFSTAMASNLFFALRAVLSKVALQSGGDAGTNLTPPNMFALVTWAAFLVSIPMGLISEGSTFMGLLNTAIDSVDNKWHFLRTVIISGLFHYLNNEVMYLALGAVHPVTLAVGNTMKRVFIMVASIMVFRNPISLQAGIGSAVGISGVLLYSLTKQYYESLEKKASSNAGKKLKAKRGKA